MFPGTRTIALLSILAVFAMIAAAFSAAADEVELEREVSVLEESDRFHAVSDSQGFKVNDRFDLIFDKGTVSLWYTEDSSASDPPSWEIDLSFEKLLTFVDDGNERFDSGDAIVTTLDLADTSYSLTYSTTV